MSSANAPSIDLGAIRRELEEERAKIETPVVPRSLDIDVKYTAPDNTVNVATLISSIKTGEQRSQVARIAARLTNNTPWELMPPVAQARFWALANISVQIVDPPDWFLRWVEEDDQLLYGVANQLEEHERRFFRGYSTSSDGNSQSDRLVVRSELITSG